MTALVLAVLISAWFAFHPTVTETNGPLVPTKSGGVERRLDKKTFVDANGKVVILVLLLPIALCAYALVERTTQATAAASAILVGFSLIATFLWTGAAYYLSSALLMLIAAGGVEFGLLEGEYD